ncbi:sigma-E factor negative regulatory protein RseB [Oceanisphaera litoralis]|uniref:MucB/RseB C-terminal domain-containing protein n=1 Tax=Oceanisphaera litoralis TaxID=225144 RepID=UPI001EF8E430|nr:MucB/RseB C-terminal domain-containing protein [Oceanisphaera litoralis]MBM7455308.1 sigma-E factor negative regulatory protein RseB [Oceanisphaera litoralis]
MRIKGLGAVILIFAWTWSGLAVAENESAATLLQRMQQAYRQLNFELTLVESGQGQLEPKRLTRGHLDGQAFTHLTHLNGRPREFVQRDGDTSFFDASHGGYTLRNASLPGLFYRLQLMPLAPMLTHYDAVLAGRSRVLGRVARVVRLAPRAEGYYGYMLWLDQETGLLLKLDTLDRDAGVVEQSMGVALRISEEPGALVRELKTAALPPALSAAEVYPAPQHALPWQTGWLPVGLELRSEDKHKLPVTERLVEYLMLSNGLVDVSVYVAQAGAHAEPQLVRQGATHLVSLVNPARVEITVVGDIPADTALRIAESVEPRITP